VFVGASPKRLVHASSAPLTYITETCQETLSKTRHALHYHEMEDAANSLMTVPLQLGRRDVFPSNDI
jgi:hypothetical protein